MSKFKVGDRVRCNDHSTGFYGKLGTIKEIYEERLYPCYVEFERDGTIIPFQQKELTLIENNEHQCTQNEHNMHTNEHITNITNITQSLEKLREENQRYREQLAYVVGQLSQHVDECSYDVASDLKDYYKVGRDSERWLQQQLASGCLSFDEYKETRKNQINKILQILNK